MIGFNKRGYYIFLTFYYEKQVYYVHQKSNIIEFFDDRNFEHWNVLI